MIFFQYFVLFIGIFDNFFCEIFSSENASDECLNENVSDERLKHIDPKMVEMIISEILDSGASVSKYFFH